MFILQRPMSKACDLTLGPPPSGSRPGLGEFLIYVMIRRVYFTITKYYIHFNSWSTQLLWFLLRWSTILVRQLWQYVQMWSKSNILLKIICYSKAQRTAIIVQLFWMEFLSFRHMITVLDKIPIAAMIGMMNVGMVYRTSAQTNESANCAM